MATRIPSSTTSLFKPISPEDVLIKGETIAYGERRHWAILIQPLLDTLSILIAIMVLAGQAMNTGVGAFIFLLTAGWLVYRFSKAKIKKPVLILVGGLLLISFLLFSPEVVAFLVILVTVGRFVYEVGIWGFYAQLYITNRRVILAEGLLGTEISTMPLTRVTDINYITTVPGDLLGYASLRVETAGQDQALSWLRFLEKPSVFYTTLIALSTAAVGSVTEPETTEDEEAG